MDKVIKHRPLIHAHRIRIQTGSKAMRAESAKNYGEGKPDRTCSSPVHVAGRRLDAVHSSAYRQQADSSRRPIDSNLDQSPRREADDESGGAKENCGCAAEKMGFGESAEARLNDNAATKVVPDHTSSNPVSGELERLETSSTR
jgi:hypothetical protein